MRTDFYLLTTDNLIERDHFACRLVEKAFLAKHTLYIATDTPEQAKAFDQLLWQFRADSFVPHGLARQGETGKLLPILIGEVQATVNTDIWLNLSDQLPPPNLQCQRLIEIIPSQPKLQETARQRYRQYRELGYTLQTHNV
jgi:DNA polymerase III subunit chi